jgi:hypothetical protein
MGGGGHGLSYWLERYYTKLQVTICLFPSTTSLAIAGERGAEIEESDKQVKVAGSLKIYIHRRLLSHLVLSCLAIPAVSLSLHMGSP